MFKFIDLFSGIGGMRVGFELSGGQCVFSSEINEECRKTYSENFGEFPEGDITKINPEEIPDHDVLCAGFPCQPFSICGKQQGFNDTRGTLFFYIMEIIKVKNPKVIFLENVKHLKHPDGGKTLKVIINTLDSEGYKVEWHILNAKDFGLAQNRERIFIIASKDNEFNFEHVPRKPHKIIRDILDNSGNFEILPQDEYTILPKELWKEQESGLIFCGHRNKSIRKAGVRPNTEHLSRVHKQPNRIYHIDGTHPTLPSQETSGRFWIYDGNIVRKLTINECFRLMGFPEDFKKADKITTLYNQIGNSVAIPVIEALAKSVYEQLIFRNNEIYDEIIQKKPRKMVQLELYV